MATSEQTREKIREKLRAGWSTKRVMRIFHVQKAVVGGIVSAMRRKSPQRATINSDKSARKPLIKRVDDLEATAHQFAMVLGEERGKVEQALALADRIAKELGLEV